MDARPQRASEHNWQHERELFQLLLEVSNALVSKRDFREVFVELSKLHRDATRQFDVAYVTLCDPDANSLRLHALFFPDGTGKLELDAPVSSEHSPEAHVLRRREPLIMTPLDPTRFPCAMLRALIDEGIRAGMWFPIATRERVLGVFMAGRFQTHDFPPPSGDLEYVKQLTNQMAVAIENEQAFREIAELRDRLAEEKLYLEDEIRTERNFDEIVGESPALNRILKQVEIVAPTDSTALILGETGTGKELVARAIHRLSPRLQRTFVKVNCSAIPANLLESELFGHEKGAFTGATAQKIGRFELADKGTLFLDEVGDLPLELQPKLLRALQEREFERLGSSFTRKADVRVVAATNRDLERMVAEGQFRADLYYRLYVFPITVPPLRDRREDIPLLVRFFVAKYARRMNRRITTIPADAMRLLSQAEWPGNIRELENFIERAVILSTGPILQVPTGELKAGARRVSSRAADSATTLADAEREHIRRVLRETDGVLSGDNGAAARLGLKRTTLQSKMKKLGISRKG